MTIARFNADWSCEYHVADLDGKYVLYTDHIAALKAKEAQRMPEPTPEVVCRFIDRRTLADRLAEELQRTSEQPAPAAPNDPLNRAARWNRITWDCDRSDFLAWRPRESGEGIEVLTYNYAMRQLPSGNWLFSVVDAPSLEAIGGRSKQPAPKQDGDVVENNNDYVAHLCFSNGGIHIADSDTDKAFKVWRARDVKRIVTAALAEATRGMVTLDQVEKAILMQGQARCFSDENLTTFAGRVLARLSSAQEQEGKCSH